MNTYKLQMNQVGKRYIREWIFRGLSIELESGNSLGIVGPNGSGKSTLMLTMAGYLTPSEGKVQFFVDEKGIKTEQQYQYLTFAAPYTELIEEFTLTEMLDFQEKFKPFQQKLTKKEWLDLLQLPQTAEKKELRLYSSGMRQRVKLALAITSTAPLLLLDEPTITLDTTGINWYHELLRQFNFSERMTVVASNVSEDFAECSKTIDIQDFKKV